MSRAVACALAAAALAITAGCASLGPQDYSRSEAGVVQTVAYGTIESVRPVRLAEDRPIVGTIAGAALGVLTGPKGSRVERG